jgi:hypothetical protein
MSVARARRAQPYSWANRKVPGVFGNRHDAEPTRTIGGQFFIMLADNGKNR